MNPIAEEIMSYYGRKDAIDISQDVVEHSSSKVAEEISEYYGISDTLGEELEHYYNLGRGD